VSTSPVKCYHMRLRIDRTWSWAMCYLL